MSRLNYKADLSALLIAGLILAVLGWFFSRKPLVMDNQITVSPQTVNNIKAIDNNAPRITAGYLYIIVNKNNSKQVEKINLDGGSRTVIYTDSDEKMKLINGIGIRNNTVIVLESKGKESEIGNITTISTDRKASKTIIQEDINFNLNPIYDKDSDQLVITDFSGVERDFGFMVSVEKIDGSNQRNILKNINGILNITTSKNKVFIAQLQEKQTKLIIYDDNGNKVKEATVDGVLINSSWDKGKIYLSIAPSGNATANQSKINVFSGELVSQPSKITHHDGSEVNIIPISDSTIAYLAIQYKNGVVSSNVEGDIIFANIDSGEEKNLGKAVKIIGYSNE